MTGEEFYEIWKGVMDAQGAEVAPWAGLTEHARRSWNCLADSVNDEIDDMVTKAKEEVMQDAEAAS